MDGVERLYASLDIICYQGSHIFWTYGIALPAMVVWGLGIPFYAFLLLFRKKNELHTLLLREKFGFLYNGYKK